MLTLIGITVLILFIILWRTGILDDLQRGRYSHQRGREHREFKQLEAGSTDPEMNERLEVFKEFMDELPDDEIEE